MARADKLTLLRTEKVKSWQLGTILKDWENQILTVWNYQRLMSRVDSLDTIIMDWEGQELTTCHHQGLRRSRVDNLTLSRNDEDKSWHYHNQGLRSSGEDSLTLSLPTRTEKVKSWQPDTIKDWECQELTTWHYKELWMARADTIKDWEGQELTAWHYPQGLRKSNADSLTLTKTDV